MGAIAASGRPGSLELFREVLLASASIPVAFPPVYIEVEVDGRRFDEMHVDGGVIAEFFLWGAMVNIVDAARELQVDPEERSPAAIYIIRNSQIDAAPDRSKPRLTHIAARSMITVLKAVAMGRFDASLALAVRDDVDFNYVGIPPEHAETPAGSSSRRHAAGFGCWPHNGARPEPWRKEPPVFVR